MEQTTKKNKTTNRLNAAKLPRLTVGKHHDGAGLYFVVSRRGSRSWVYRYGLAGQQKDMGLGAFPKVSLSRARELRDQWAAERETQADPIALRRRQVIEERDAIDFRKAADLCLADLTPQWTNPKHAKQWPATLERYAFPAIGREKVKDIDTPMVVRCLSPIWASKRETAKRLRGRIEAVLDWAIGHGYRAGPNPATTEALKPARLPRRPKGWTRRHHPSLPYTELPAFVTMLQAQPGQAAEALLYLILTGARTGEVIAAKWSEINLDRALWSIPADRMKMGREHRVPLSDAALALLRQIGPGQGFVFPGRGGSHMSNGAMLALLRRMKRSSVTPHGFRNTLKDWAMNRTTIREEIIDRALAHAPEDDTDAAYFRDIYETHIRLMTLWGAYATGAATPTVN